MVGMRTFQFDSDRYWTVGDRNMKFGLATCYKTISINYVENIVYKPTIKNVGTVRIFKVIDDKFYVGK
jgi:hypothetical protein